MCLIQEKLMRLPVTSNAQPNIATGWAAGVGESFVHGIQNEVNICAFGEAYKPIINIDQKDNGSTTWEEK